MEEISLKYDESGRFVAGGLWRHPRGAQGRRPPRRARLPAPGRPPLWCAPLLPPLPLLFTLRMLSMLSMLRMLRMLRARAFVRVSHAVGRPCVLAEKLPCLRGRDGMGHARKDWRTAVGAVPDIASGKLSVQAGPRPAAPQSDDAI